MKLASGEEQRDPKGYSHEACVVQKVNVGMSDELRAEVRFWDTQEKMAFEYNDPLKKLVIISSLEICRLLFVSGGCSHVARSRPGS